MIYTKYIKYLSDKNPHWPIMPFAISKENIQFMRKTNTGKKCTLGYTGHNQATAYGSLQIVPRCGKSLQTI